MSTQVGRRTYQTVVLLTQLCCPCSVLAHALMVQLVHVVRDLLDYSHQHHASPYNPYAQTTSAWSWMLFYLWHAMLKAVGV